MKEIALAVKQSRDKMEAIAKRVKEVFKATVHSMYKAPPITKDTALPSNLAYGKPGSCPPLDGPAHKVPEGSPPMRNWDQFLEGCVPIGSWGQVPLTNLSFADLTAADLSPIDWNEIANTLDPLDDLPPGMLEGIPPLDALGNIMPEGYPSPQPPPAEIPNAGPKRFFCTTRVLQTGSNPSSVTKIIDQETTPSLSEFLELARDLHGRDLRYNVQRIYISGVFMCRRHVTQRQWEYEWQKAVHTMSLNEGESGGVLFILKDE